MYPVFYRKVAGPIHHITGPNGKVSQYHTSSLLPIPRGSNVPPGGFTPSSLPPAYTEDERGIICILSLDRRPRAVNE